MESFSSCLIFFLWLSIIIFSGITEKQINFQNECGKYITTAISSPTLELAQTRTKSAQTKCTSSGEKVLGENLGAIAEKTDLSQIKHDLNQVKKDLDKIGW